MNVKKVAKGFTLIELILYIGLLTIFISGAILFAWDIIYGRVKSRTQQEVTQNLRLASKRILYEIRNASGINTIAASCISLANTDPARNPTIIDVSGNRVRIGFGAGGTCASPPSPYVLTNNEVAGTLTFTNLTSGTSTKNIRFVLTIADTGDRKEWQFTKTYTADAEIRSN